MTTRHLVLAALFGTPLWSPFAQYVRTQIHTGDVTNFWTAFDQIMATSDIAQLQCLRHRHFIDPESPGQRGMFAARRCIPDDQLHAIRSYPRFWTSVRANMLRAEDHASAIRGSAARLQALLPTMRSADIHFTVGVTRSGGTIYDGMVPIGTDVANAGAGTTTNEPHDELGHLPAFFATNRTALFVFMNVHELVHTQQPGRWGYDHLAQCLHEGIVKLAATLAMNAMCSWCPSKCPSPRQVADHPTRSLLKRRSTTPSTSILTKSSAAKKYQVPV